MVSELSIRDFSGAFSKDIILSIIGMQSMYNMSPMSYTICVVDM